MFAVEQSIKKEIVCPINAHTKTVPLKSANIKGITP